ncbi:type II toxin-antitoxin system RelB/DinJ family antitoxin [uncultured Megasphaera sp.]|uniref:type II toxin-antitoxin system RelB/DinJ family antitoxin n=1 Tax=uncultured Megasphaera sp. TaxID=165188 RepID=UPI0025936B9A|nr:type II toxin-antitoxin system RelB/DinJ family antitoxin [uncultured Megasphaera sp.]
MSFRIDSDLKQEFETFCDAAGINMTAAIHLFIKATVREQRIPFEIKATGKTTESRT